MHAHEEAGAINGRQGIHWWHSGGTTASFTRRHHPAGRVKVYDSIVKFLDKGDSGAKLRRPDSARLFQGIVPQSVLLPVCSHGVS